MVLIKAFIELNWTNVLKAYVYAVLALFIVDVAIQSYGDGFGKVLVPYSMLYLFVLISGLLPILAMVYVLKVFNIDRYIYFILIFLILYTAFDIYNFFDHLSPRESNSTYGFSTRDCRSIVDNVRTACGYEIWAKGFFYSIFEAFIAASVFNKFYKLYRKRELLSE